MSRSTSSEGRGRTDARLESHRRYIDIQLTLDGDEEIGWRPLSLCRAPVAPFDEQRDIRFYDDAPDSWVAVPPGRFAIFFPDDAHAPLARNGAAQEGDLQDFGVSFRLKPEATQSDMGCRLQAEGDCHC